jgi:hypothetical protein
MEMTEEQRYEQQVQMERDKIALLKRIADALDRAYPNIVMKSKDEIDKSSIVSLKRNSIQYTGCLFGLVPT